MEEPPKSPFKTITYNRMWNLFRIGQFNLRSRCFEITQKRLMSKHLQTHLVNLVIILKRKLIRLRIGGFSVKKDTESGLLIN